MFAKERLFTYNDSTTKSSSMSTNINGKVSTQMEVAQANYSLNLLRQVAKPLESIIVSPFSITEAFGIVYVGAAGKTKAEIQDVLAHGCSEDELRKYLLQQLRDINAANKDYDLNTANRLYYANRLQLKTQFVNAAKAEFGGQFEPANFKESSETAKKINDWVEEKTNSKIKNLIQPSMVDENTCLAIINAIYFKGKWSESFDKSLTQKQVFYVAEGKEKSVDMMHHSATYNYYYDNDVQVVGIPYQGDSVTMYVILPNEKFGLENVKKKLDAKRLFAYFHEVDYRKVEVTLPKFTLEKQFDLKQVMLDLGIKEAFTREANFSEMCSEALQISEVIHKAFIEVNEEGTEAAAATGVCMMLRMAPMPEIPPVFVADHPFMFAIVKDDNLLFVGQYY